MKIISKTAIFLFIVVLILEGINIYLSNKISLDSIKATKITSQIEDLSEKNTLLSSEVIYSLSLDNISSRAAYLGFVEPKEPISFASPLQVALKK
ncbi:MAG: hypothetical protein COX79_03060 [Candidatus Levybacteria bacterium CG_4_10_14_0_2_um_filter_36_16]|nr:MAG: hypothetical protein AUK12_00875 [Candidatus Levybacteria bacterium CG2_30_37_29]PIR79075.1 MAG: hypothetical protein COU26_03125 [Candidatus Levybacteria bacterium CG10_big_fil_rev_8_21_14_0_10_36_30]PIZ97217.1 MAG: hypothetical protein COX79_03060 [Candidatus Levybacteria bacterium CG_4_10_14_0_2_um_filter_36_16]PJA90686.1 MAG: hypothetical protein CO136_01245 [Candidatus Levybacteria bacterium CG_4_9_14_3_um_filter_36_7]